jgi:FKBP12-rapamycin complex-associated protein
MELPHAQKACRRYRQFGETRELGNAWGIYFGTSSSLFHCDRPNLCAVFQKLEKPLPQVTAVDLQYISPELLNVRNPGLAI